VRSINGIRWIGKDYILASLSSCTKPSYLALLDIRANPITSRQISYPGEVLLEPMKRLVIPGTVAPASFYCGPAAESVQPNSVPLILMPHGGIEIE